MKLLHITLPTWNLDLQIIQQCNKFFFFFLFWKFWKSIYFTLMFARCFESPFYWPRYRFSVHCNGSLSTKPPMSSLLCVVHTALNIHAFIHFLQCVFACEWNKSLMVEMWCFPKCHCLIRCKIFNNLVKDVCFGNVKPRIVNNTYSLKLRGVIGVQCVMCQSHVHCESLFGTSRRNSYFILCEECALCFWRLLIKKAIWRSF